MSQTVQDDVFDIIAKQAKIERDIIKPDSTLKDLGIASLDAIEVIFDIEEHFNITMPDREANFDADTVQGLIDAVNEGLATKAAAADPSPN
jgi:acyl carrier protein